MIVQKHFFYVAFRSVGGMCFSCASLSSNWSIEGAGTGAQNVTEGKKLAHLYAYLLVGPVLIEDLERVSEELGREYEIWDEESNHLLACPLFGAVGAFG